MTKDNLDANSSRLACCLLLLLVVLMVLAPTAHAAAGEAPALSWELINPFRFISKPSAYDEVRRVYERLDDKTAAGLERELQRLSEEEVEGERTAAAKECEREPPRRRQRCLERAKKPYPGWDTNNPRRIVSFVSGSMKLRNYSRRCHHNVLSSSGSHVQ